MKKRLPNSEFARNVLTLMTGTTIAQAIPIAISPILTRIYTPEDFGILALYNSVLAILAVIVTMRYELAIVQPQDDEDAVALLALSIAITVVISLIALLGVWLFNQNIAVWLNNAEIANWLYFLPMSVFLSGCYQSFNYYHTRKKNFKNISLSNVVRSASSASLQTLFGYFSVAAGLILGQILASMAAVIVLLKSIFHIKTVPAIKKIKENAKKYRNLPKYSVFGALSDAISIQMPIFVLTKFFSISVVGFFGFVMRVLNIPASILSGALSQVFLQKIASMQHEKPEKISAHLLKIFLILCGLMLPFLLFIYFLGEVLFVFVFGEPWREAGKLAEIIIFAVAARFVVSPLSAVLTLKQNIKLGVLWQVIYLLTISTTLLYFSNAPIEKFLWAFVMHEVCLYSLYFIFIMKGAKNRLCAE